MVRRCAGARVGALALSGIALLLTSACVVVREEDDGKTKEVNISTPVGALAVTAGESAGDTGLPIYPGAELSKDDGDGDKEQANVSIGTPWFGLHVRAAEYTSGDAPERILDFYRERMKAFGDVTECRGEVDFRDGRPVCRARLAEGTQLVAGTEDNHRIVVVKPRSAGSELALVSIQTGKKYHPVGGRTLSGPPLSYAPAAWSRLVPSASAGCRWACVWRRRMARSAPAACGAEKLAEV